MNHRPTHADPRRASLERAIESSRRSRRARKISELIESAPPLTQELRDELILALSRHSIVTRRLQGGAV